MVEAYQQISNVCDRGIGWDQRQLLAAITGFADNCPGIRNLYDSVLKTEPPEVLSSAGRVTVTVGFIHYCNTLTVERLNFKNINSPGVS